MMKKCHFCGKEFTPYAGQEWKRYCSDVCMGNAWIRVTNWLNGVKKPYRKLMTVPIKTGADEYNRAARREEVKALYEGGMPVANIARKLNVSIGAVRNDMKVLGLKKTSA